jgi:hypothetical protein
METLKCGNDHSAAAVVSHRVWFDIVHGLPAENSTTGGEFTVEPPTLALGSGTGAEV